MSFRYYQPPKVTPKQESDDSSDSESDAGHRRRSRNEISANKAALNKRAGACVHCKSLKVKCNFIAGQEPCQRCMVNKLECVVYGRKKRRAVATHEELVLRSHRQDQEISQLLRQFDQLTVERQRSLWLSKACRGPISEDSSQTSSRSSEGGKEALAWSSSYGHRSPNNAGYPTHAPLGSPPAPRRPSSLEWLHYYPDSSVNERSPLPELVATGFVSSDDVQRLFNLFFDHINPYFSILDPNLHTPTKLLWHHHFLFTIVCTCAARIDEHYFKIYPAFVEVARTCAGNALVQANKDVADCQAFLLCAVYQTPKKKWEDQRGWLYMGIAFTLAQELNLGNVNPVPGMSEREHLNRIRTWLNCYCVDWSHATQFGKPAMISVDDFTARSCREWYRSSSCNLAIDVHLVAYVEMLRTMGHFKKEMTRPNLRIEEVLRIAFSCYDRLATLSREWSVRFAEHPEADAWMCPYRSDLNRMINAYNRLVVLSYGFQKAVAAKGVSRDEKIVRMCIETAKEVIDGMTKKLYYTGMLKYSMDPDFCSIFSTRSFPFCYFPQTKTTSSTLWSTWSRFFNRIKLSSASDMHLLFMPDT
ncbi:hypothetical protein SCHPADRAFT_175850 [Schizopora paradoxa]|uniref:Zn(2)-C6 fungal-type domain-containing protein n=1 Tax=Schizopora paradoxa TaxID=27342 RepID=A0A0H2SJA3_9AGAM|nr:hypothetical protein SCHPADRAFT_175850 [Schizopora paradoxa]